MATWRFVNLNIKEGHLLADLAGIRDDLEATDAICNLLMKGIEIKEGVIDFTMSEALSAAAVVRYARAFKEGKRSTALPKLILSVLSGELLEKHKWAMALRNKYVAHSVNVFEDNQVVAYLVPEEKGPKGISSITVRSLRLSALGTDNIADLKTLCAALIKKVDTLMEEEKRKVLEAAKQIPIDELYALKAEPPVIPKHCDVGKERKRK